MKREKILFEKVVLDRLVNYGGPKHVAYSDEALAVYDDATRTIIQAVAEHVWRECNRHQSKELIKAKQKMYEFKRELKMYRKLYLAKTGCNEKRETARRKYSEILEMEEERRDVTWEEYFRVKKLAKKMKKERDQLGNMYQKLREEKRR